MPSQTSHVARYGVFRCQSCPEHACGDSCGHEFADELPAFGDDYWPACKCCGLPMQLIAPLATA
jgi:hypothetical protein